MGEDRWAELDSTSAKLEQQIDLLINHVAGDAFIRREQATVLVLAERRLSISATLFAGLLSGAITWLLARRIRGIRNGGTDFPGRVRSSDPARGQRRIGRAAECNGAHARQHTDDDGA
jgi:hypothetical protein